MITHPKWKYHHTKPAVIVKTVEEEDVNTPEDDGWRDFPYSDAEKADLAMIDVDDTQVEGGPKKPLATDFTKKKDFVAAMKKYEEDLAEFKK